LILARALPQIPLGSLQRSPRNLDGFKRRGKGDHPIPDWEIEKVATLQK